MNAFSVFLRPATLAVALLLGCGLAVAKSVPGDGAIPVVELMPLTLKHEADLKLTAEQIQALDDYRKQAMPGRVALHKKKLTHRRELRMAILDNPPPPQR
ncbi:MAG: hypothetical protein K0M67_17770, partial [Thiobacillus sp.]|nr:hypothetical protein [Thiobacillus sp.]